MKSLRLILLFLSILTLTRTQEEGMMSEEEMMMAQQQQYAQQQQQEKKPAEENKEKIRVTMNYFRMVDKFIDKPPPKDYDKIFFSIHFDSLDKDTNNYITASFGPTYEKELETLTKEKLIISGVRDFTPLSETMPHYVLQCHKCEEDCTDNKFCVTACVLDAIHGLKLHICTPRIYKMRVMILTKSLSPYAIK